VKKATVLLAALCVCAAGCGTEDSDGEDAPDAAENELVITDYGAVGDGKTDCAPVINNLIAGMSASGGCVVIPAGEFLVASPIVINRNFVTLRGVNSGEHSGADPLVEGQTNNTGGGSKLICGEGADYIISIGEPSNTTRLPRVTGVEVRDLMLAAGSAGKTGIWTAVNTDRLRIANVNCVNLELGMKIWGADAALVEDSWISECARSIEMNGGVQNTISRCQLGTFPIADYATCLFINEENLNFTGNQIYPDAPCLVRLLNCRYVNITANNFKSFYNDIFEITNDEIGRASNLNHDNLVSGNIFWMQGGVPGPNDVAYLQLRFQAEDYGLVRVRGDNNVVSSNTIIADWDSGSVTNPVVVRFLGGRNNRFSDVHLSGVPLTDTAPARLFLFDAAEEDSGNEIINCVAADKVAVTEGGDKSRLYITP